jgi:threonine synthase
MPDRPGTAGWVEDLRCAVCAATVATGEPWPWRCPNESGDRHHLLRLRTQGPLPPVLDHESTLVAFAPRTAWWAFAAAHGVAPGDRLALAERVDAAVAAVDGTGFRITPCRRADELSAVLGFSAEGGIWAKDETGNVAGSHKARHLAGVLLHLLVAEAVGAAPRERPPLAIASCGNAALAAATLARAVEWRIRVFVPPAADPWVLGRLHELGADVVPCPRRPGSAPGDPAVHAFRDAVADGAVPFSVQGPENALCLDTGRSIGWELAVQAPALGRMFVQVGGGALATCTADGLREALGDSALPRLHAVQTEGCAPLARAWERARVMGLVEAAQRWGECMWPWDVEPRSAATGILDDETYDWLGIAQGMAASAGSPVVVREQQVAEAAELGPRCTGIPADATGTAGLAGLLALRADGDVHPHERVAVLLTGRRRTAPVG